MGYVMSVFSTGNDEDLAKKGLDLFNSGNLLGAAALLREALEEYPESPKIAHYYATVLWEITQSSHELVTAAETAFEYAGKNGYAESLFSLAYIKSQHGEKEKSLELLTSFLEKFPDREDAKKLFHNLSGVTLSSPAQSTQPQIIQAPTLNQQQMQQFLQVIDLTLQGEFLLEAGRITEALKILQQAVNVGYTYGPAIATFGRALSKIKHNEAQRVLLSAVECATTTYEKWRLCNHFDNINVAEYNSIQASQSGYDEIDNMQKALTRMQECAQQRSFNVLYQIHEYYMLRFPEDKDYLYNAVVFFNSIGHQARKQHAGERYQKYLSELQNKNARLNPPAKFSVIMPCWNRKGVIEKAIESVLIQDYPDFELIISDDGSTDGSVEFIREKYHSQIGDGKIVLLENEHKGVSHARNQGLKKAEGEWIAYLDSDNTWRQGYLTAMAGTFSGGSTTAYALEEMHYLDFSEAMIEVKYSPFNWQALCHANFIDMNVFCHHRKLYEKFGGFNEKLKRLVDWELIIRYTHTNTPMVIPVVYADYYLEKSLGNISKTVELDPNMKIVREEFPDPGEYEPHVCNICGNGKFLRGPNGRLGAGGNFPYCVKCQSLERHRMMRSFWLAIKDSSFSSMKVLQISDDLSVDPSWFDFHERSIYGGENSLDIQDIDRPDNIYDAAICNHVIEHVPDDIKAVSELLRVVKDDGILELAFPFNDKTVTTDWGYPKEEEHGHYRLYGQDFIERFSEVTKGWHWLEIYANDPVTEDIDRLFLLCKNETKLKAMQGKLSGHVRSAKIIV